MDQLDIAVHQTAHEGPGGLPALARRIGVREQVLRNKVCPTTEGFHLNLREAVAMMDANDDDRILKILAEMRGYTLQRKRLPDAASIVSAVLSADAEHGDVSRTIQSALADGKLTDKERAAVINQINEAQTALDVLKSTVLHAPTNIRQA
jgi:hypothetical protein